MAEPQTAAWREQLLSDMRAWLDQLEHPPADIAPLQAEEAESTASQTIPASDGLVSGTDLYALYAEMAALRQEVRLQNREQARAVRQAEQARVTQTDTLQSLEQLGNTLGELVARQQTPAARRGGQAQMDAANARRAIERSCLTPLLEVRDALVRGQEAARRVAAGHRWLKPRGITAVVEGYQMALERFDRTLATTGIQRLAALGEPFDPRTMVAIQAHHARNADDGVVLEELLAGFIQEGGAVLRAAEVVVNARPSGGSQSPLPGARSTTTLDDLEQEP
jgi:molecular chaperone GrpE